VISIDGSTFDVPVLNIKRSADVLDKYAERTIDGKLHREIIGVYYNYQVAFGRTLVVADYHDLWDALTEPVEFHTIIIPDEDGNRTFQAYITGVSDEFVKVLDDDATRYMKSLVCKFIAQSPSRTPA